LPRAITTSAQNPGFKEFVRKGIHIVAGDHAAIDIAMSLGSNAESVEVVAETPLVNTENASTGQAITTQRGSPFDHPHHFVFATTYELPIGKGRALNMNSRWMQTGAPILWVNGSTTSPGRLCVFRRTAEPAKPADERRRLRYIAIRHACGGPVPISHPHLFDHLRRPASGWHQQLRHLATEALRHHGDCLPPAPLRAFNVLNHPTSAAPNTTATNSSFGLITSQANLPRQLQFGARFVF
jgi:hypothetical protein